MYSITKNHILDLLKIGACLNHGKVFPHHFQTTTLEDNYSWELGCCFWGSLKGWFRHHDTSKRRWVLTTNWSEVR